MPPKVAATKRLWRGSIFNSFGIPLRALAGPTVKGEAYPTGQLHPPAHAGCRCLLVVAPA